MDRVKIITGLLLMSFLQAGCAEDQGHMSSEEFCEMYNLPMGTMKYSKYIGEKDGRAVIELYEMSVLGSKEWSKKTFWTEVGGVEGKCLTITK